MDEEKKAVNMKKIKIPPAVAIAAIAVLVALIAVYIAIGVYFQGHFFWGSTVNGIESGGQTAEDFAKTLNEQAVDYTLTVAAETGDEEISPEDVGLTIAVSEEDIAKLVEQQSFGWIKAVSKPQEYEVERMVSYDKDKLAGVVSSLACVTNPNVVKSENATYEYEGGEFRIKNAVYGNEVNTETLTKVMDEAILTLKDKVDLKEDDCYIKPEITEESEELQKLVQSMNDKTDITITYKLGSKSETIDKDLIVDWLTIDEEKGEVSYDQEKIAAFVSEMASKYNTYGKSKSLKTAYGSTVTVAGGTYGWRINQSGEVDQIIKDLNAGEDVTRDFVYTQTAASHDGNDYGNTYIEVNITAQHMYCYVNGAKAMESDTVTGCVSKNRITHNGAYFIQYCERNATLHGADYETDVAYWMPFHIGEGFHDATWNPRFGGQYYINHGSHGCVNLPYSAAQSLFSYAYAGMPVLIYELPGTENTSYETGKAKAVMDQINAIGTVTLDKESAITAARSAYNALSSDIKSYVSNLSTLTAAEQALSNLKSAEEQKTSNYKSQAQSVINKIAAIGDVTYLSGPPIQAARSAYDSLPEEAKQYVTNYNVLTASETAFKSTSAPSGE